MSLEQVKTQHAILYFNEVLAPESDLIEDWGACTPDERRAYRAALLREVFDDSYEELSDRLKHSTTRRLVGYDEDAALSPSSIWGKIDELDLDQDLLDELTRRTEKAMSHTLIAGRRLEDLGPTPGSPDLYYDIGVEKRHTSTEEKISKASEVVAEYMQLALPHLGFERNRDAPNYKHPPEAFYRLMAHLALEDCYAENGAKILRWLSDDGVAVPSSSSLLAVAEKFSVDQHSERFFEATAALLERDGLLPPEPVHLAFDVTKIPWYGEVETVESDDDDEEVVAAEGEYPNKHKSENNTVWNWHYAVLSISAPGLNYVIGAEPVDSKETSEYADALDWMLEKYTARFDHDLGRIYLDRGLEAVSIVDVCEKYGLNWLMQGKDTGKRGELMDLLDKDKAGGQKKVEFGDEETRKIKIFACPANPEEMGVDPIQQGQTEDAKISEFTDDGSDDEEESGDGLMDFDPNEEESGDGFAESSAPFVRTDLEFEGSETHNAWNTNMDVKQRNLKGLAYQYRYRWRIETAIRQLKHDFQGRCGTESPAVRAFYFGVAQLFFNFWVALNRELPFRLNHPGLSVTGLETLHALREADFDSATAKRELLEI